MWVHESNQITVVFLFCDKDGICVCVSSSFVLYSFVQSSAFYISSPIARNIKTKSHNGTIMALVKTFIELFLINSVVE